MHCPYCKEIFESHPHTPSYVIMCPNCCKEVSAMSEYGFGPVYPAGFYLGERKVAEVVERGQYPNLTYVLERYLEEDIILEKKKYPELMGDAFKIVYHWLVG